jgi:predicted DNA-binding transcriptional regulator AlpA
MRSVISPTEAQAILFAPKQLKELLMKVLVKLHEVMAQTGLSRSHVYSLAQIGHFPRQVKCKRQPIHILSDRSMPWHQRFAII